MIESKPDNGWIAVPVAMATWGSRAGAETGRSPGGSCDQATDGGSGRADHDIRTDSTSTPRRPVQRSIADADKGKDHRDFYGDRKDA